jgi:hypothetical protein
MRQVRLFVFLFAVCFFSCARPIQTGAIVERYSRAECVPVRFAPGIQPPTRSWDYTVKLSDGVMAHVSGAAVPGGRIDVTFTSHGTHHTAANAGDYIYPADVRFDDSVGLLYVKASGKPAAFGEAQTWLFVYDLRQRRQRERALVDPDVLPGECAALDPGDALRDE